MKLGKILTNPTTALSTFTTWVIIFVIILGFMGAFSKKFLHFGPSTDPETATEFLGAHIDSWTKVIALYILGFVSSVMHGYYSTVFGAWMMNSVKDDKAKNIEQTKNTAHILVSLDPIISNINSILELFLTLTLQLQFLLPQILGDIFASIVVSKSFLSKKKSFGKRKS